jgi:hypothetical protein
MSGSFVICTYSSFALLFINKSSERFVRSDHNCNSATAERDLDGFSVVVSQLRGVIVSQLFNIELQTHLPGICADAL